MIKIYCCCLLALLVSGFGFSDTEQPSNWKGKIKVKDGVRVVKNPSEPVFGKATMELQENLSISSGKNKDDVLAWVTAIKLDDENNIYVLDSKKCTIFKFNQQGDFVYAIGHKGNGPMGFQRPRNFYVKPNGEIVVLDNNLIHIMDNKGNCKNQMKFNYNISKFLPHTGGNTFISYMKYLPKGKTRILELVNTDLTSRKKLVEFFAGKVLRKTLNGKQMSFHIDHFYRPRFFLEKNLDNLCVIGHSSEYALTFLDDTGKPVLKVFKDEEKISISDKEKKAIYDIYAPYYEKKWSKNILKEALQFPDFRGFFYRVQSDDKGRVYVFRLPSIMEWTKKDKKYVADVFSKDGYFLYQLEMPIKPNLICNGNIYATDESDDSGEIYVKRFEIKNWDKLKDSI